MATLVLSAIGTVVGGPIGGAIGTIIGGVIDRDVLFKPKGTEGPRLTELQLQTSSYGTPLQQVFGTMRIGGCVIWSTDLTEHRATSSGGKGQPSSTTYSYSASFAVALSGRPIRDVGRIWADGNLLRGSAGDFKVATGFRLHPGGEDQAVDPLIAAAEGAGLAPAHRGLAYAVFEDLPLGDFGNRIPSLTFELIADDAAPSVGGIAGEISDGSVTAAQAMQPLGGFAAYGDSVKAVLEMLAQAGGAWFAPNGAALAMRAGTVPERIIADGRTALDGASAPRHGRAIAALETVPRQVTLMHYDPARDYQSGLQQARRPGAGASESRVAMPAAIDAGTAKTMAEAILARAEAARERRTVTLGWDALDVLPGACVTIAGVTGIWRVTAWSLERMLLSLECVRLAGGTLPLAASAGRVLAAPDLASGTTVLHAFEALPLDDSLLAAPRVTIVAAGTEPGWRRAALLYSIDGGARWTSAGATAAPGTIGRLASLPGVGDVAMIDRRDMLEVDLLHVDMALAGADDAALDAGANLALVGEELLQFGSAEQIGPTRWRLSTLWRGRRATEAAIGTQAIGDRFVLVEPDAALSLDLPLATLGTEIRILASGAGDTGGPVETRLVIGGASVLPPSPVHLTWSERGDGTASGTWARRSRQGWRWIDGVDVPLGEEREAYRVQLTRGDGTVRTLDLDASALDVARADRIGGVTLAVRQVGAHGESAAAALAIPDWTA